MELRCPTCGSLLYSQRARLCGQCGTLLPPELVLTDEQAAASREERQWARNLADTFDTTGRVAGRKARETAQARSEAAGTKPESLICNLSCASEFKHRKRNWVWWLVLAEVVMLLFLAAAIQTALKSALPWHFWLMALGAIAVNNYFLWLCASPICPNCRQNIRHCPAAHCHVCGQSLRHGRCANCGMDATWTGWFRPQQNGSRHWIEYCPGCGVELDTCILRWRFVIEE